MKKILLIISIIMCLTVFPVFSQTEDMPVNVFESGLGMTGLICEATGFGLVVGGGATASLDLGAALIMMQIAPVFSTTGAWCMQAYIEQTSAEWEVKGLSLDTSGYINDSRTAAIGTTAFTAGALLTPLIGDVGIYISLGCTAVAVIWDMLAFYGSRSEWMLAMNEAIRVSGLEY